MLCPTRMMETPRESDVQLSVFIADKDVEIILCVPLA